MLGGRNHYRWQAGRTEESGGTTILPVLSSITMAADYYVFERLLGASSHEELSRFLVQHCSELGYNYYFYSQLIGESGAERFFKDDPQGFQGKDLASQGTFTTYPSSWIQRYVQAEHVKVDPVVRLVATSNLPVFWEDITLSNPNQVVFDEARQYGLANGITVPIRRPSGRHALFSVATDLAPERLRARRSSAAGTVLLTAMYLDEVVQRLTVKSSDLPLPSLTPREKECLHWAANGKTSWEIGNILVLSERTAIFHLWNATKKLGAANRRQAVVRAISLGLIQP